MYRKMKYTYRYNRTLYNTKSRASCGGHGSPVSLMFVSLLLLHLSVQLHHSLPLLFHYPLPRHRGFGYRHRTVTQERVQEKTFGRPLEVKSGWEL